MPADQDFDIRVAEPADEPALAALEQAAPDGGQVAVRLQPRLGYLDLAGRYPGVTGVIAVAPGESGVVGMLFSSVAATQFNGAVVPGAYLFSLRVHPALRRRGAVLPDRAVVVARINRPPPRLSRRCLQDTESRPCQRFDAKGLS